MECYLDVYDNDSPLNTEFIARNDLFCKPGEAASVELWTSPSGYMELRERSVDDGFMEIYRTSYDPHKQGGISICKMNSREELERYTDDPQQQIFTRRAFFIKQKNSHSRLQITREMFSILCKLEGIFENIKEFTLSFGFKVRENEIGPPRCRFNYRKTMSRDNSLVIECAYGLRYVEKNNYGGKKEPWSIRQVAIYQKFNNNSYSETWLFMSASKTMKAKIKDHLKHNSKGGRSVNPFQLHLFLIQISLANWRWYIKSLVERTNEKTSRIVGSTTESTDKSHFSAEIKTVDFEDRQGLKVVEDRVLDLLTIFDSTLDTIGTFIKQRKRIRKDFKYDIITDDITLGLEDSFQEAKLYRKRSEILLNRVQGAAKLLSDLLNYDNAKQSRDNGYSLKIIAEESREENVTMRVLTEKSTKDAEAVKVITIITIIYLPTTVVASFFSTQFVFQEQQGSERPKLSLAENWWIYAAVSLPLTIATIVVWYAWVVVPWKQWLGSFFNLRRSDRKKDKIKFRQRQLNHRLEPNVELERGERDSSHNMDYPKLTNPPQTKLLKWHDWNQSKKEEVSALS